jgi:hypothetical protein
MEDKNTDVLERYGTCRNELEKIFENGGAGKWVDEFIKYLKNYEHISYTYCNVYCLWSINYNRFVYRQECGTNDICDRINFWEEYIKKDPQKRIFRW